MNVGIVGTGSCLPSNILSNKELAVRLNIDEEWILRKTGIRERHIVNPDEATSDLAIEAARRALESCGLAASEIDLIALSTSTGDQLVPATSCHVQAALGANNAIPLDVSAGCSGFLYSLRIGHDMLRASPEMRHALIIGSEVMSRFVDYEDKRTCVLFGDGAGAVVIAKVDNGGIANWTLGADGRLATQLADIPAGGSRLPASAATLSDRSHYLKMDGRKVREFISTKLHSLVSQALEAEGLSLNELNLLIPHPPNERMVEEWINELGLNDSQVYRNVENVGNTGSASIPIALDQAVHDSKLRFGDTVLFLVFGGGGTWGTTLLRWVNDSD